jgi:hypothetical protein
LAGGGGREEGEYRSLPLNQRSREGGGELNNIFKSCQIHIVKNVDVFNFSIACRETKCEVPVATERFFF